MQRVTMHLLVDSGSLKRSRKLLLSLETFATLLLQALFALALSDLDHIILSSPATLVSINCNLVTVAANLGSGIWPERHGFGGNRMDEEQGRRI